MVEKYKRRSFVCDDDNITHLEDMIDAKLGRNRTEIINDLIRTAAKSKRVQMEVWGKTF